MTPLQTFGVSIEDSVIYRLQQLGYDPDIPLSRVQPGPDLTVNDIPLHVKAARRKPHKTGKNRWTSRYQFNFRNVDTSIDGFIIAVCVSFADYTYFVIPTWMARKELKIVSDPREYRGWASRYRAAWNQIKEFDVTLPKVVYLTTSHC